jgi:GTP cyclohydrolase I
VPTQPRKERRSIDRKRARNAVADFLRAIGRDPAREPELAETPARVTDAFVDELCEGYSVDVPALLDGEIIAGRAEVVVVRDLAVTSMCPHHLMPSSGSAAVAFAPRDKIVGIGAVGRVVDAFARRLTLQETIGEEVVAAIFSAIGPRWVACRLGMSHTCMTARGGRRHGARVETFAFRGKGREEAIAMLGGES